LDDKNQIKLRKTEHFIVVGPSDYDTLSWSLMFDL